MKLFNYNITSDKEGIHPIYVCDACRHELDRCCNSEVEFTMTAEFHGHNPRGMFRQDEKAYIFGENESFRCF